MSNKKLVIIAGPTGVGKTDLGISIAESLDTEIISADSRQIYREMSIGTAVPSHEQRNRIKHHFIQEISINDYYNASMYEQGVLERLDKLFLEKETVVMVGGTGLYIDAVRNGIDDLPTFDPYLRRDLQQRIENEGIDSLRKELKILDPVSYHQIDLRNPKRVQKALEISIITGKPYSEFLNKPKKERPFNTLLIALNEDRNVLYGKINKRVELMMANGWLEECRGLLQYKGVNALNTVGYKELFYYLEGLYTLDQALERIKASTRRYARKQITWFRRNDEYSWFRPDQENIIKKFIENEL